MKVTTKVCVRIVNWASQYKKQGMEKDTLTTRHSTNNKNRGIYFPSQEG